jgi:hypothetical protein
VPRRWATFQSREFHAATRDVPKTPGGQNPYELMEMTITKATTLDEIAKQFRELVVRYHPDQPGGSHEKMAEINAAHGLIKEHHAAVIKRFGEVDVSAKAQAAYHQRSARQQKDNDLSRTGGLNRQNTRAANMQSGGKGRTQREIEQAWEVYRAGVESDVKSMCSRYELAVEQIRFFKKSTVLNEVTVRERWLRKAFLKSLWEEVHEIRTELLRHGAKNAQQSQLAADMVGFATMMQRKLNEDFSRTCQISVQSQMRIMVTRFATLVVWLFFIGNFLKVTWHFMFHNSFTVRYKKAFLS